MIENSSSSSLYVLAALAIAGVAVNKFMFNDNDNDNDVVENFGMLPSFGLKTDVVVGGSAPSYNARGQRSMGPSQNAQGSYSINSVNGPSRRVLANVPGKTDFYTVPGTYQAMIAPRAASMNYGSNIKYNLPSVENLAIPPNPLTFSNMVKEGYSGGCAGSDQKPFMSGNVTSPGYSAGNYQNMLNKSYDSDPVKASNAIQVNLPIRDMTMVDDGGADETITQPIIYDRFMVANRNSRIRSQGDMLRGDLPIEPRTGEMFAPSVQPNLDLQLGAMNVMGGFNNSTSQQLANLVYDTTSGATQISGGKNLNTHFKALRQQRALKAMNALKGQRMQNQNVNTIANQFQDQVAMFGDVNVTAYP